MARKLPMQGRGPSPATSKALDFLRTPATVASSYVGKRRFDLDQLNPLTVAELLDAVAVASAGIMFGFNRGGNFNIMIFLEGDRESYVVRDEQEFKVIVATLYDALWTYAIEKFPDVAMEAAAREAETSPLEG